MAWFSGRVSLGGFPDLAGAVNKLSESVKNIEKNFDSALGFEEQAEKSESTNSEGSLDCIVNIVSCCTVNSCFSENLVSFGFACLKLTVIMIVITKTDIFVNML